MKSFKQFESHTVALNSAEDDNLGLFNIHDEKVTVSYTHLTLPTILLV